VSKLPAGTHLWEIAVDPVNNTVYLPNSGDRRMDVLHGSANFAVPVGNFPCAVALNLATHRAYVLNYASDNVTVVDMVSHRVLATVAVGRRPQAIAVDTKTNRIYVANTHGGSVTVIDGNTNSVVATVAAGDGPFSVAVNPVTNKIYVANRLSRKVTVIDGTTNRSTEI
jgi:YVTN family beta-propeller protein